MFREGGLHSLPVFLRLRGRPVILVGIGDTADAKRRLLERAGAIVVGEEADARLAIVVDDDAAIARLKARGVLVNAVDRPAQCDFTLPAIVDRDPVLVAVGTGGASAGLAAAIRQWLETLLPGDLGTLADALRPVRGRERVAAAIAAVDFTRDGAAQRLKQWSASEPRPPQTVVIRLASPDPDDLSLRQARWLAAAERVVGVGIPEAVLARARADAARLAFAPDGLPGLTVRLEPAEPAETRVEQQADRPDDS